MPADASLVVLHGVGPNNTETALQLPARPCLNPPHKSRGGKRLAPDRQCDVMIDTGMNRLGLRPTEIDLLEGLTIELSTATSRAQTRTAL